MEQKVRDMYDKFYSFGSMLRWLPPRVTKANIASWVLNFSQRKLATNERNIENFDGA